MAIYHPKISFHGQTNYDLELIVSTFNPDNGEVDSYLDMEPVYTDSYDGTIRTDYGAKYKSVATPSITFIEVNGSDINPYKVRNVLRWLTGSRKNSWMDVCDKDGEIVCSYLGRFTDVKLQKEDARVIGIVAYFTSVSPWAYSKVQSPVSVNLNGETEFAIDNLSDDLYSYVYPKISFKNGKNQNKFSITNSTIVEGNAVEHFIGNGEKKEYKLDNYFYNDSSVTIDGNKTTQYKYNKDTGNLEFDIAPFSGSMIEVNSKIRNRSSFNNLQQEEVITIDNNFVAYSDNDKRIFDDDFNFVFPRLIPGTNKFFADGVGTLTLEFRYPMKVADGLLNDYDLKDGLTVWVDSQILRIKGDTTKNPPVGTNISVNGTKMIVRGDLSGVKLETGTGVENGVLTLEDSGSVCPFDEFDAEVINGELIIKKSVRQVSITQ
ncbi:MAG: hypothetical protein PUE12_18170 [Oscillospiraceae bacterium]|nr:hypothetical protein [Oscillospiraceae bacterium]